MIIIIIILINQSLFPKIYDYSTGIFFNYTRYLNSKENRKINIWEIKEYFNKRK